MRNLLYTAKHQWKPCGSLTVPLINTPPPLRTSTSAKEISNPLLSSNLRRESSKLGSVHPRIDPARGKKTSSRGRCRRESTIHAPDTLIPISQASLSFCDWWRAYTGGPCPVTSRTWQALSGTTPMPRRTFPGSGTQLPYPGQC